MKLHSLNKSHASKSIAVLPRTEFSIETLEHISANPDRTRPERLEVLEIIVVKHGNGRLWCDASTVALQPGSAYVLVPGQVRCLSGDGYTTGYVIRIAPDFVRQLHDQFDISFMIRLALIKNELLLVESVNQLSEMEIFVMKLLREFERNGLRRQEVIRSFVKLLLIHLSVRLKGVNRPDLHDRNIELLRSFFVLLWRPSSSKKLVGDYADELCVTANYLNTTVRRFTGYTASYHIQQQIVLEAKRHAVYSMLQMKEIAYYLGFEDHAHFSTFFKNYSGMSFSTFRKSRVCL